MSEKILVIGGTGLIGRALMRALVGEGYEVVVFTRFPEKRKALLPSRVRLALWEPNAESLLPYVEGAKAVVNLSGENLLKGIWTKKGKRQIYESRVGVGRVIAAACQKAASKPEVLLQMSAVGYYGDRGDSVVDENTGCGVGFLPQLCRDWEASTEEVEGMGVRRVVMRTGIVLSGEGGFLKLQAFFVKSFLGAVIGEGTNYIPWIHIKDHVRAMLFFLKNSNASGVYNLVAPNPVKSVEFMKTLATVCKRPLFLKIPPFLLGILPRDVLSFLTASLRVVPKRLLEDGFCFEFKELDLALADLLG